MKRYTILALALGSLVFWSCSSDKSSENAQKQQPVSTAPVMTTANTAFHYVCPNGCAGGGGAAQGACPTCGSQFVHNAAYHTNQQTSTPNVSIPAQGPLADPSAARVQPGQAQTQTTTGGAQQHYICPNGCAGSGGDAQGTCPVCGSEYAHNAAYHSQSSEVSSTTVDPSQAQTANPAQNAAGVFHYTCSNGCAGGSGSAGTCATCGGVLAHNQAYHQ